MFWDKESYAVDFIRENCDVESTKEISNDAMEVH